MAMNGTGSCHLHFSLIQRTFYISVDEKLAWLFKLYDKDSNGEIVQEEMEDIFLKLCRIVEKTEVDAFKKHCHCCYYYYLRCQLHCYCHRPRWTTSRSTPSSPRRSARRRWEYFFIGVEIFLNWPLLIFLQRFEEIGMANVFLAGLFALGLAIGETKRKGDEEGPRGHV